MDSIISAKKIIKESTWALFSGIAAIFMGAGLIVFLTRHLSPDLFGVFMLFFSLSSTFIFISAFGINQSMKVYIAKCNTKEQKMYLNNIYLC